MQANGRSPIKMKRQNDIYKDSEGKEGQREIQNGRIYGNIPYL